MIGSPYAHRFVHFDDGRARRAAVDEQREGTVGAARSRQASEEQPVIADGSERNEVLFAAQIVGIAFTLDAAAQVGAGAGRRLGQRERDLDLALRPREERTIALLPRSRNDPSRATSR